MSFASRGTGGGAPGGGMADYGWRPPTTFVDVLFLLLMFFITIAATRQEDARIDVNLQQAGSAKAGAAQTHVNIAVTREGQISLNGQPYDLPGLKKVLGELANQNRNEAVYIHGDQDSRLGTTVQVLDAAYAAGLRNVSIAARRPAER